MTDNDSDEEVDESERVSQARANLTEFLNSLDDGVRQRLADAVTVAGERPGDLRTRLGSIGQRTAEVAEPVLDSVEDHIKENDINVTISGNEILVEGDEDGVKNVNADLQQALSEKGVRFEYDRDDGISVEIEDKTEE